MRLVQKLSLALIVTTTTILAIAGVLRVYREVRVLEFDRMRDHHVIGRSVGSAIAAVWRSDGQARALAVLEQSNIPSGRLQMRWVWLDGDASGPKPAFDAKEIESVAPGETITRIVPAPPGEDMRYTYVPLAVEPQRRGALELSESLVGQKKFKRRMILDTLITTVILVLVCAGLATLLGMWIVGRPMRALADKARRVGQGDFTNPLIMKQDDELAGLAREMNMMCDRLVLAHDRVADETAQRLLALEQLRHADRLTTVGKLASGIAHELGTPLNVVSARAQMIAGGEATSAETVDYARIIVGATERMTRIIRQLLEFARRKGSHKATAALEPLAKRTLEMVSALAASKNIDLVLDARGETFAEVDANPIEQVFTNLVVNAVQSMAGPGVVRVSISKERAAPPVDIGGSIAEFACVRVTDAGAGIPAEDVAHVFEPFFTTKDVGEGTGLGLSVAYGIVREHGGWIDVVSTVGRGSSFAVYLPAKL
jgi:two-component system NtrC family sensor kinase